jgi:uncharacterized membrane protein
MSKIVTHALYVLAFISIVISLITFFYGVGSPYTTNIGTSGSEVKVMFSPDRVSYMYIGYGLSLLSVFLVFLMFRNVRK